MRHLLSILVLILSIGTSLAQSSDGRFSFNTGLTYNHQIFAPSQDAIKGLPSIQYHFSFAYLQPLSERLGLLGGLGYRTVGSKSKPNELRWGIQHNGSGGFDPTQSVVDLIQELQFFSQYRFIQVPLHLRLQAKNNSQQYWQLGFNNMLYLNTRSKMSIDGSITNDLVERNAAIRSLHTALQLEMGWLWPLGEGPLQISLAPSLQFHLTPLNLEGRSKEYIYNGGLTVGLWW